MNIQEAINEKMKVCKNFAEYIDITDIAAHFDVYSFYPNYEEVQGHWKMLWLERWLCTDTYVGQAVYFLDGAPCCITTQPGRKYGVKVMFFSKDDAIRARTSIYELNSMDEDPEYASLNGEFNLIG
jgi:hypothetical protein